MTRKPEPAEPEWYSSLRTEPFQKKTFTSDKIYAIERAALAIRPKSYSRRFLLIPTVTIISIAVAVIVSLSLPSFAPKPSDSPHTPTSEWVTDDQGNVIYKDRKWLVSIDVFETYQAYKQNPSDETLFDSKPLDMLKMFFIGMERGHYATIYTLIDTEAPSVRLTPEQFEDEAKNIHDAFLQKRDDWRKRYSIVEETVDDASAIRLATDENPASSDRVIRLRKVQDVWKIDWSSFLKLLATE